MEEVDFLPCPVAEADAHVEDPEDEEVDSADYSWVRSNQPVFSAPDADMVREREPEYHVLHDMLVANFEWQWKSKQVEWLR